MAGSKAKRKARHGVPRSPSSASHAPAGPSGSEGSEKSAAKKAETAATSRVATPPPAQARFKTALVVVAFLYLCTVWFEGIGSTLPAKLSPRVWLYFSQVAALFRYAGMMSIDYRAEGWSCAEKKWIEIDVRPWFRIESETKENRFHRALQFYRRERKVMRALEEYVIRNHNASSSRPKIGGVRFLSLRIPYPKIGDRVERVVRKPLSEYPEEMRRHWYWTPTSKRYERCGERPPAKEKTEARSSGREAPEKDDDERSSTPATSSAEDAKDKEVDP